MKASPLYFTEGNNVGVPKACTAPFLHVHAQIMMMKHCCCKTYVPGLCCNAACYLHVQ